jgi:hypothetical protein
MKKADWEILHNYKKIDEADFANRHMCPYCRYCENTIVGFNFENVRFTCVKKEELGVKPSTKPDRRCDLWKCLL